MFLSFLLKRDVFSKKNYFKIKDDVLKGDSGDVLD